MQNNKKKDRRVMQMKTQNIYIFHKDSSVKSLKRDINRYYYAIFTSDQIEGL